MVNAHSVSLGWAGGQNLVHHSIVFICKFFMSSYQHDQEVHSPLSFYALTICILED